MSMLELQNKILNNQITLEEMQDIYNTYGMSFIIKDGKIKGFSR